MDTPNIIITINNAPVKITYNYGRNQWTVHHEDKLIQEMYTEIMNQSIDSNATLFRMYSSHPRLDVLEELSKEWGFKISGMKKLRSWLATHQVEEDSIVY